MTLWYLCSLNLFSLLHRIIGYHNHLSRVILIKDNSCQCTCKMTNKSFIRRWYLINNLNNSFSLFYLIRIPLQAQERSSRVLSLSITWINLKLTPCIFNQRWAVKVTKCLLQITLKSKPNLSTLKISRAASLICPKMNTQLPTLLSIFTILKRTLDTQFQPWISQMIKKF